ncbi:carbonic anhydrase [Labilibaculum manganireducens]|uniref:Carbonic anhydrase n=1 Tax=Labilibaculum manganireducens TaxID=1940525 RepID=A0A2N3IBL3_9BACT|nr:carbonic anhydrase [Labilibaculum manganireducens]PKQ67697.1 carbonic anhydrase [Labilibaculum manganireducens]
MNRLLPVNCIEDILPEYRHTPIGLLLEFHNLKRPFATYTEAQLLVGMCMDNRKHLHIPENFSYIIRSGGANLRYSEFKVSYAISVGGIKHIALIGHNNCGMVNLHSRKDEFISGLVGTAGWTPERAEEHFTNFAPMFEIGNEIEFVVTEAKRLRVKYPKITVAPLFYHVETNRLSIVEE